MTRTSDATSGKPCVGDVLDEYLRQMKAGSAPDREDLLSRHPELAEDLRAALLGLDFVRGAAPSLAGESPALAEVGASLGDYRLLREVGRGGMAVVYEAEQVSLRRRVALKVLPFAAVLDPKQLQRFKNEALAAAHLQHPHIVPVHGVGCERGVHYYAMQYIEGQSLATAIREMKDGAAGDGPRTPISSHGSHRETAYVRMAADLGRQAAEALDHAHQLGIVHRDVKPGNLLVDAAGTLWIADFGIARSLHDTGLTMTGELVGTVRYMSPEQALGRRVPIDHRTDVYSLGATLYELFTLEPAFPGDDPHVVITDIASKEPAPARKLNPALPVDLETIVLKAMSKDAATRYATAQDMADDLQRFLDHEPVRARRPSLGARAARWARRHRGLVGAGLSVVGVGVVLLAVSAASLAREERRTRGALESAQENLRVAVRAIDQYLVGTGTRLGQVERLPAPGRRALLEGADRLYERHFPEGGDAHTRSSRSALLHQLGRDAEALAEADGAIELDPTCSLAHLAKGNAVYSPDSPERAREALTHYRRAAELDPGSAWARLNCGIALLVLGKAEDALAECAKASALDPRLAPAHAVRGDVLRSLRRFEEAVEAFDLAISIGPAWAEHFEGKGRALFQLGRHQEALEAAGVAIALDPDRVGALHTRGAALLRMGRHREALEATDRAIALEPTAAASRINRANALLLLGDPASALVECGRALALDARIPEGQEVRGEALLALDRPEEALRAFDAALALGPGSQAAHGNRGLALLKLERPAEALAACERAVEIDPGIAAAHHSRGLALMALNAPADALEAFGRAIAIDRPVAAHHAGRAGALAALGRLSESVEAYHVAIALAPGDARHPYNLGIVLARWGRPNEALESYDRALAVDPSYAEAHVNRGGVLLSQLGRFEEALAAFDRAVRLNRDLLQAHLGRGWAYLSSGRTERAQRSFERAIDLDPRLAEAHVGRGAVLAQRGDVTEALESYDRALDIDSSNVRALLGRAAALRSLGQIGAALEACDRAIAVDPNLADAYADRARILSSTGDRGARGALRDADRALELGCRAPDLWNFVAWNRAMPLDAGLLDVPRAVACAKEAVRAAPREPAYWKTLGIALCRSDPWREALEALEKSVALGGGDATTWLHMAMAHHRLDHADRARGYYEQAVGVLEPGVVAPPQWERLREEVAALLGIGSRTPTEDRAPAR